MYSLGHEGTADINLAGIGRKTLTWMQAAVQWVGDKLLPGTHVFNNHDPNTNSHEGRIKIGEVVGKTVKYIGDHLNALAAIYILPEFKTRPLDFASIEADIEYAQDGFQAWPTAINSVSGIALGNSGTHSPGIPGATLLGAVQAYVQAFGSELGGIKVNKSEVLTAVKDLGLIPSQVFDVDVIMGDSKVVEQVNIAKKNVIAGSERITKERDTLQEKVVVLENQIAEKTKKLEQQTVLSKSATVFDTVLADPERKLDDKQKAFAKRNFTKFESAATDEATLKADVGKFVDGAVKEFSELATIFGPATPTKPSAFIIPPENIIGNTQTPGVIQDNKPAISGDFTEVLAAEMDPNVNPLIPGGNAAKAALKT